MDKLFEFDPLVTGVKGLIFIGDRVLIYRRDENTTLFPLHLDVPGGGTEDGETPFETFVREATEEFSLTIRAVDITYSRAYPNSKSPGKITYFVVAKLPDSVRHQIQLGDEGTEFMLMTLREYLARRDAWPLFQERSADYARSLK